MKSTIRLLIVSLLISFSFVVSAQHLKVTEFRAAPLDLSARERVIYDPNGDPCAIIKARTGIKEMSFTCDLEIRKVELHDGEYWLWVSPGTHKIVMEAPGFQKVESNLPSFAEGFNVYILFITTYLPEKTLFRTVNTIILTSKPSKANVYINDVYYGRTPVTINLSLDNFEYKIEKKTFTTQIFKDSIIQNNSTHSVVLKKNPYSSRFYASTSLSYFPYGGIIGGASIGKIGKTGCYLSFSASNLFKLPNSSSMGYVGSDGTFYLLNGIDSYYFEPNKIIIKRTRVILGLTQQVNLFSFLYLGIGYANTKIIMEYKKIPRSINNIENSIEDGYDYGLLDGNYTDRFILDAGVIFRIKNRLLLSINNNFIFNLSEMKFTYKISELHFGAGYNF
jgi:hypothetical protein